MKRFTIFIMLLFVGVFFSNSMKAANEKSVFTIKPNDPEAFFFTPENFGIKADGKMDVSEALQKAINELKSEKNFGILYIPEGKYKISKTIYVPGAIRLIGYGEKRPEFILAKNTPGYQDELNFMFWFTGGIVTPGGRIGDAGAGTFYSGFSNINIKIENGNPKAVALRTHYAQHGVLNNCNLYIGNGYAGIYDIGNEMDNVNFYGGEYGITSSRTSPSWPMMMVDLYFEGQKKAAIITRDACLTIVNMHIKNAPIGVELQENYPDKLYMENCLFENLSKAAVSIGTEYNANNAINMINVDCKNVPTIAYFAKSGETISAKDKMYKINEFTSGLIMDDLDDNSSFRTVYDIVPLANVPSSLVRDIPALPEMETWVNIRDLGAKGDDATDDTKIFQDAIDKYEVIYVPQGWYIISSTLKMKENTKLIGLHPMATQLKLTESSPLFSGFGSPVPLLESSVGGTNILSGIGINTNSYNNRAVGVKWMANAQSYMNDVKYVGGHGTMNKPVPRESGAAQGNPFGAGSSRRFQLPDRETGKLLSWDNQYWSLWVTNGGGGTFKNIWTASTFAASGFYVSNTSTPSRVYAMSLEHHVRSECRLNNVSNWKFYSYQFEEESVEGKDCISILMTNCSNITFANTWFYRVIRVTTPRHFAIYMSNNKNIQFKNIHSWTQILYLTEAVAYDVNKNIHLYPSDFAKITVSGNEKSKSHVTNNIGTIDKIASNLEFATGAVSDSKGNVYFCENRLKKIYRWDAKTNTVSLYADYPWKPFSLAVDTQDNLLVVCRYDPQRGYLINGEQEQFDRLPDDNPNYSSWGNSGWKALMYAISPDKPDDMQVLKLVETASVSNVQRIIYPTHRLRSDFDKVAVSMPQKSFIAPDGVTIIPETYDLCRSVGLFAVTPGQPNPVYTINEGIKATYKFKVEPSGILSNLGALAPRGEYGYTIDNNGRIYVADGQIFVFDNNGEEIDRIDVEERPLSLTIGGKEKNTLFITTSTSVYKMILAPKKESKKLNLVWQDEFDYNGLPDASKWNIVVGKSRVNNEPQWYTNNPKNINVADGVLTITCLKEEIDGEMRYTSGRMDTRGKFTYSGGRAEARVKLPKGRGVWPAFWSMGTSGRWPVGGEIDILEYWGHNPQVIASNVHTGDYNHTKGTGRGGEYTANYDPCNDFHIVALEWYEDRLDFYFDDNLIYSCQKKGEGHGEWPFDTISEFLIVNFALWNNLPKDEPGIDDSIFPQKFIVDYVRVYDFID